MIEPVDASANDLRIVSRAVTDEEIAAVTAVLQSAREEHAAMNEANAGTQASAWEHSARGLRTPLAAGPGAWRRS